MTPEEVNTSQQSTFMIMKIKKKSLAFSFQERFRGKGKTDSSSFPFLAAESNISYYSTFIFLREGDGGESALAAESNMRGQR